MLKRWVGLELSCIDCVRNDEDLLGRERSSQRQVISTRLTDSDRSIKLSAAPLRHLVQLDGGRVVEAKERVVSEHTTESHHLGDQSGSHLQDGSCLVAMHNLYLLSYPDLSEDGRVMRYQLDVGSLSKHFDYRDMIDL